MSQEDVLFLLKKLGGKGTTEDVRNLAKKLFSGSTLFLYVLNRLRKLERNGYIKSRTVDGTTTWIVKK
jgi:hypothetical protein